MQSICQGLESILMSDRFIEGSCSYFNDTKGAWKIGMLLRVCKSRKCTIRQYERYDFCSLNYKSIEIISIDKQPIQYTCNECLYIHL